MKEKLHQKFLYSKQAGALWSKKYKKFVGSKYKDSNGKSYIRISFEGKRYKAHRLIMIMHGFDLSDFDQVDHIDGDGLNNRLENLRVVSNSGNSKNQKIFKNNKTGIHGVYFAKHAKKWCSQITSGKRHHLGYFDSFFDACCARKSAEIKMGFHENHGKRYS